MASKPVLQLGEEFNSYEDFHKKLWEYQVEKNAVFTVRQSKTIEQMNRIFLARGAPLLPSKLKYAYVTLGCKRGGPVRIGTGTGMRPLQS